MHLHINRWDVVLLLVATAHATTLAYTYDAKRKALLLSIPSTFTVGTLAVGKPVQAGNAAALVLLLGYTFGVRWLHVRFKLSVVSCIIIAALSYCLSGALLNRLIPSGEAAFWIISTAVFALGLLLHMLIPHMDEPGHRTPLPVWKKVPLVALTVCCLIALKGQLQSFMSMFPVIGVIASYEARKSLYTMGRQIPVFIVAAIPMMWTCRLIQTRIGIGPALLVGWIVFFAVLWPISVAPQSK